MEALADAICLRALGLGAAVIDILDREVELVFVALAAAELGAAIGQHARQPDAVLVVERHHPIIENFGGGDRLGFRMPAQRERSTRARGPAFESLR